MAVFKKGAGSGSGEGSTAEWKSTKQRDQVVSRLVAAGFSVDEKTAPAVCWNLLTNLLLDEVGGRRPSLSPPLPPIPKPKNPKRFGV